MIRNYQRPTIVDVSGRLADQFNAGRINSVTGRPLGSLPDHAAGIVIHHTGGGGTINDVINTFKQRDLVSQIVVGRDGTIYQTMPTGSQGWHVSSKGLNSKLGVSNDNALGIEVIAKDDKDVTPAQVAAVQNFYHYVTTDPEASGWRLEGLPSDRVFNHGEVNPGQKQATEGLTVQRAIRSAYPAVTQVAADQGGPLAGSAGGRIYQEQHGTRSLPISSKTMAPRSFVSPVTGTWAAHGDSPFGAARGSQGRHHAGNDLQAASGSSAVAAIGGRVVYTGNNEGYQWNAVVVDDDGNAYRYATHGPLAVKVGQRVEAGDKIGTIARGHLHFEVMPAGTPAAKAVAAHPGQFVSTQWWGKGQPQTVDPAKFFGVKKGMVLAAGRPVGSVGVAAGIPPADIPDTGGPPVATAYTGGPPLTAAQRAAAGMAAAGTLRKGATDAKTGGAVTRLQQQLAAVPGGPPVAVDGKYGRQTEKAVQAVERQYGLNRDRGVAGPQVQAALAGNERMRIVADTQARFGGPLAPGGVPAVPGAPPNAPAPIGLRGGGQMRAGYPPTDARLSALVDVAPGVPPVPLVARTDRNRFDTEAAAGGRNPPVASVPPASGYDTRGVSAGLSSPNVGAANALMQQVAARQAAAPPVSRFGTTDYFPENVSSADYTTGVPGRTGNAPAGINSFGDIADAWRRIGGDVAGLFGGPPTSTATPRTSVPQGFAPIPPAVPESASPVPSGYNRWGRQISGGPAFAPTSLGGDLSRLGTPGERAEDVPGEAVGGSNPRDTSARYAMSGSDFSAGAPWSSPSAAPAYGGPVVPGAQQGLVNPGGPIVRSGGEFPGSDLNRYVTDASTLLPGGAQFQASGAELPAAGDSPAAAAPAHGGVPYATNPLRHFAGYTDIGNAVVQTPQPPPSLGARIAKGAATFGAGALGGPAFGMLASVIGNSLMRSGGLDNAQPYRGQIQGGNYAPAGTTQWGSPQYYTGSSYSNSPFTPSGAGWNAPSFSPVSGGPLYSYQPNGQGGGTYVDSQGRVHNY